MIERVADSDQARYWQPSSVLLTAIERVTDRVTIESATDMLLSALSEDTRGGPSIQGVQASSDTGTKRVALSNEKSEMALLSNPYKIVHY